MHDFSEKKTKRGFRWPPKRALNYCIPWDLGNGEASTFCEVCVKVAPWQKKKAKPELDDTSNPPPYPSTRQADQYLWEKLDGFVGLTKDLWVYQFFNCPALVLLVCLTLFFVCGVCVVCGVLGTLFRCPFWHLWNSRCQENVKYLPGITLPEHVKAEPDLKKA